MKRFRLDVPCCEGELEAWRVAAGDVPLARWARRVLNGAAGRVVFDSHGPVPSVVPVAAPTVTAPFRPDFKGGGR